MLIIIVVVVVVGISAHHAHDAHGNRVHLSNGRLTATLMDANGESLVREKKRE